METKNAGHIIKTARESRGLSVSALARLLGVAPSTVWRHERGARNMTGQLALKYQKTLGLELSSLVEEGNTTERRLTV